jgi:hypothetical protein
MYGPFTTRSSRNFAGLTARPSAGLTPREGRAEYEKIVFILRIPVNLRQDLESPKAALQNTGRSERNKLVGRVYRSSLGGKVGLYISRIYTPASFVEARSEEDSYNWPKASKQFVTGLPKSAVKMLESDRRHHSGRLLANSGSIDGRAFLESLGCSWFCK